MLYIVVTSLMVGVIVTDYFGRGGRGRDGGGPGHGGRLFGRCWAGMFAVVVVRSDSSKARMLGDYEEGSIK